jgi:formate hydrogenlyase subunit 3/multisubunit Na+/H+ antiporter MnhD subunit
MSENKRVFVERRRGPDKLTKWIKWTSIIGWLLIICVIFIISEAKPRVENFFDKLFHVHLRKTWDEDLLRYSFFLMVILFFLCAFAFIFNLMRHKRKTDRFNKSIIILGIVSFVGSLIYLLR